ncbi:MAG TPA: glycosyltransferase [Candidatus Bathyarchaeia archaeon]|nr:glycosyltransferase [Candidatus Bathyarchaeia archaeon]
MRIAIFHNFLDNIGGAEMVTLILARELKADIYTTNIDFKKITAMGFSPSRIFSIGTVPVNAPLRQQIALWRFRHLNLKGKYDFFIIAGDWAMSAAVHNTPNLWYVHSPIREIWDLYTFTRTHTVPPLLRWGFDVWAAYNRRLNRQYIRHVNHIACNSQNTRNRVQTYLNRTAVVCHPPIETMRHHIAPSKGYWLSVNRLIHHKRIDIQIKAFTSLPNEKLIIVGSYEASRHFRAYAKYIRSILTPNVEIRSWVNREELLSLYASCKGFITTAQDEDFGMAPVEAMASGKPVIASNEGGYKETVTPLTGILLNETSPQTLAEAIGKINTVLDKDPGHFKIACLERAQQFDTAVFIRSIRNLISLPNEGPRPFI